MVLHVNIRHALCYVFMIRVISVVQTKQDGRNYESAQNHQMVANNTDCLFPDYSGIMLYGNADGSGEQFAGLRHIPILFEIVSANKIELSHWLKIQLEVQG